MSEFPSDYRIVRGSDVHRDGMFLELSDQRSGEIIAEVFYSDVTHEMVISVFRPQLPTRIVEMLLERAKHDLPPAAFT
jgi:hypothetical protein